MILTCLRYDFSVKLIIKSKIEIFILIFYLLFIYSSNEQILRSDTSN